MLFFKETKGMINIVHSRIKKGEIENEYPFVKRD